MPRSKTVTTKKDTDNTDATENADIAKHLANKSNPQSSYGIYTINEIYNDTQSEEVTFTIEYHTCSNVTNQQRVELLKYHIALYLALLNKNNTIPIHNKFLETRPNDGSIKEDLATGGKNGFCISSDNYSIFKGMIAIPNIEDPMDISDKEVKDVDNLITQELQLRIDNKCKPNLFGYGQNYISDFFKYHKSTYDLLTCLTVKLLMHPRLDERLDTILKIRPEYIKNITKSSSNKKKGDTNDNTNVATYKMVVNNYSRCTVHSIVIAIQKFVDILSSAFDDAGLPNLNDLELEIFLKCGMGYDLMRESIINFNQFQLTDMNVRKTIVPESLVADETGKIAIEKKIKQALNGVKMFNVKYNHQELSRDFDGGSNLLFHGSPMINWHSLLYNGPYVPNHKNGLIDNGAAYGIGVYLSPTSGLSVGYTGYRHAIPNDNSIDKYGNSKIMMGIFQIKGDMSRYKKATHVYVCPDTDQLCLKYLIYGSYASIPALIPYLDKFCDKGAGKIVNTIKNRQVKIGARRIMGEIKQMNKRDGKMGDDGLLYNFHLVNESINIWRVKLPMAENFKNIDHKDTSSQQPLIYQDARKYKIDNLEIEITLPEDYPVSPPFVRVVSPRFTFRTGHITCGGSVCTELLTKGGWVSTTSIMSLILMLKQNMYDGGARIDPTKLGQVYGYEEACSAYNRMLSNHPEWTAKTKSRS